MQMNREVQGRWQPYELIISSPNHYMHISGSIKCVGLEWLTHDHGWQHNRQKGIWKRCLLWFGLQYKIGQFKLKSNWNKQTQRWPTMGRWPLATERHVGYSGLVVIPTLPFDLTLTKVLFRLEICNFSFDVRSHFKLKFGPDHFEVSTDQLPIFWHF